MEPLKQISEETKLKILKYAVVLISEHGSVAGNRCCQDWSVNPDEIMPPEDGFTEDEKKAIAFNYQQYNSDGEDYDEDYLFFHDEMSVSFMLSHALGLMVNELENK